MNHSPLYMIYDAIYIFVRYIHMSHHYSFPPPKKQTRSPGVTLIMTTSPIPTHPSTALIDRAIEGIANMNYKFEKKIISYDKPKKKNSSYETYIRRMKKKYPDFCHLEMKVHGHFIGSLYNAMIHCNTKYVFMNQHDIELNGVFPISRMKRIPSKEWNIISTHHMKDGLKESHWFPIVRQSTFPDLLKTWGWSERIFLTKTDYMMKQIYESYHAKPKPLTVNFIESVFHKQFNSLFRKTQHIQSYKNINYEKYKVIYNDYWNEWKTYNLKSSICYHTHLHGRTARTKKTHKRKNTRKNTRKNINQS
jgi:hypothetical protein